MEKKIVNKIGEKVMCVGGKRYVENVCMYGALFRLYSGINPQTAHCTARRRCRRGCFPSGDWWRLHGNRRVLGG